MNNEIYLKIPTEQDEEEIMQFRKEFLEVEDRIPGSRALEKFEDYSEWLSKVNSDRNIETVEKGRVPSDLYITVNKQTEKIVGIIQIRQSLNPYLEKFGGHIGDAIRPTERNKGYATTQIALALEKCKELGIKKVLITCKDWNKASARTIEKNGGELENTLTDDDGNIFLRYWINL